jgi:hypothetical protein
MDGLIHPVMISNFHGMHECIHAYIHTHIYMDEFSNFHGLHECIHTYIYFLHTYMKRYAKPQPFVERKKRLLPWTCLVCHKRLSVTNVCSTAKTFVQRDKRGLCWANVCWTSQTFAERHKRFLNVTNVYWTSQTFTELHKRLLNVTNVVERIDIFLIRPNFCQTPCIFVER